MEIKDLQKIMQDNGVVGAGGAGFPSYAKLTDKADTILLNCAECEPLLKLHRQLLEKHAYEIMKTFHTVMETVGASQAIIGIKKSYVQTIKALQQNIEEFPGLKIHLLDEVYPMGDEVVLIYEATGRVCRPGGLPIEQGVIVFNVETIYNVYQALESQKPVTEKYVSVVAEVEHPVTVKVPLGCTLDEVVAQAGNITTKDPVYFVGGPMMGRAVYSDAFPIIKNNNAILAFDGPQALIPEETGCIKCGRCHGACPFKLLPVSIAEAYENKDVERLQALEVMQCMECGSCSYICPARRPLAFINKMSKGFLKEATSK